jgi:hypothetical protein
MVVESKGVKALIQVHADGIVQVHGSRYTD